ncbi:uncharacterized protein LOC114167100 isoform X3 [Vigna unguiculata]|uniref:uncharacterized protein LOC114167100 isoform X3 n=1 Tax=Vigna unguiculata TaxID=3917 RepID=UPI001016DDD3|nr:uncharacterized protein LOC114167100 isoform X3 [Vigna unguiculata]
MAEEKSKGSMEYVKLVGSLVGPLLGPGWPYLKPLLYKLVPYEIRVGHLAKDVNKLRLVKSRVQDKVKDEENRNERAISGGVKKWLDEVDEVIFDYEEFLEDEDRSYAVYSDGYLPKPSIRYRLRKMVNDIGSRVSVLLQTSNDDNFSCWLGPPSYDADFDNIRYQMFESRNQTTGNIIAALANSSVGMIGVYGLNGVGKTSLIKEVVKKVKDNMFDVVIMVNVTSRPDIRRIQGQIAKKLGMKLKGESESERAVHLRDRLKDPKLKTLIILDNLEVKLDFNMLGISSENNDDSQMNSRMKDLSAHHNYALKNKELDASILRKVEDPLARYKGCKILMISKNEQLLVRQMDGKAIKTFCVTPLTEKEAESMFKTMSEIDNENSLYKALAAQISKKCKGLPMTIVATAKALKNKSLLVWEDAYRNLERQNLTAVQEFSTKLSYNLLENDELKHTLLVCARMSNDALLTDLVRNCIGLGLLQGIYMVKEARDRIHMLVAELKELSLLSDSFSSDRFTMQDNIRDAVLSIASQEMHAFALTKGKLEEWPDKDKLERCTAISLQNCDVTDIMNKFPETINCFRLRVFHLENKDPHLKIPDNFFIGMKELRVLILIGVSLSFLPSSIMYLKKLRMLCLERCKLDKHLSIIGELETLRVLSLSGSDVEKLPTELSQLTKLQIFDISNCFKLREIPVHVLSSLIDLEELYVGNSPIQWKYEGHVNASLSELRQLYQLTTLDIEIPGTTHMPENLFFDKLDSYNIVIRDVGAYSIWDIKMLERRETSRFLALQLENGFDIHHQKDIKILFERVENLLLGQLNDVEDIFYELNYEGFPYLKYLSIVSNSKIKSVINSKNQKHLEKVFPRLESLFLYEVNHMEHICYNQLTTDSFGKLKIIKLNMCGQLKNVFFSSTIKLLSALEAVEVSECDTLKEIVTSEAENREQIIFPELRSVTLQSLSELIGFYGALPGEQESNKLFDEKVVISKLERMKLSSIKIQKIWSDQYWTSFQNLIKLDVTDCWNLKNLLSFTMSKSLMNLQSLLVSECGMMESIFEFIETEVSMFEIEPERIFPKLKNINLGSMKRLKEIWHPKFPLHSFGKLDELIIEGCNKLKNVFPSYMIGRFHSLCNLKVTNCLSMKEIFDLQDCQKQDFEDMTRLQSVHAEALPKLEHVWNKDPEGILNLKNLKKIWIQECLNLEHIFPVSTAKDLQELEYLEVWNCGKLKKIVSKGETNNTSSISFKFPKLTTVRFSKLPSLEGFYEGEHELHYSALNNLCVESCPKLELFSGENTNSEIKSVFFPEKAIYNLKSMQIESENAIWLRRYMGNYRMHKLEEFQLFGLPDTEILYFFIHRNPNMKSLLLSNCSFKELVPPRSHSEEKSGVVPKLKSLKVMNLQSLKMIDFKDDTILFQRLECLILKECPCLNTIAPSSISFTYLTTLEVGNCNKLACLMTPSTAKSLVQLTTMKVIQCEQMKTIVSELEHKEHIIFRKLKEIELVALQNLLSFCSSNHCAFDFPLLEKFVVSACSNMRKFSQHANSTPILRQILIGNGKEEKRYHWKGDLNVTISYMHQIWALHATEVVDSNPYKPLENSRLKILKLANCELGSHAIPTVVFSSLKNLEELEANFILESLKLDWKNTTMLCNGKFPDEMLHQVIKFELDLDKDNDKEVADVILKKMPHAECIRIKGYSGLKELTSSQHEHGESSHPPEQGDSSHHEQGGRNQNLGRSRPPENKKKNKKIK